jgi:hypothetical protein
MLPLVECGHRNRLRKIHTQVSQVRLMPFRQLWDALLACACVGGGRGVEVTQLSGVLVDRISGDAFVAEPQLLWSGVMALLV